MRCLCEPDQNLSVVCRKSKNPVNFGGYLGKCIEKGIDQGETELSDSDSEHEIFNPEELNVRQLQQQFHLFFEQFV